MRKLIRNTLLLLCLLSTVMLKAQGNLITNGEFETWIPSNQTDYLPQTGGGIVGEGYYYIDDKTNNHGGGTLGWPNLNGLAGHGNFMMANGYGNDVNQTKVVWKQEHIPVVPGVRYVFSCKVLSILATYMQWTGNPCSLKLKINGNVVSSFNPEVHREWLDWTYEWTNQSATEVTLAIYDYYSGNPGNGDDFGLDVLSFQMAAGYSVSATGFNSLLCYCDIPTSQNYFDILLNGHYTCNSPSGSVVPTFEIQNPTTGEWLISGWNGSTVIYVPTPHGSCFYEYNSSSPDGPKIRYFPNSGYYGSDQIVFRVKKYGLTSQPATIALTVANPPSNPVTTSMSNAVLGNNGTYYLCVGNASSFAPTASWTPNGNNPWPIGWEWSYNPTGPWNRTSLPSGQGVRYVRFWADNLCGSAQSEPLTLNVCSSPEITNNNSLPASICAGSSLPNITVDWHYSEENYVWEYKRNGTWQTMNNLGDLQDGDRIRYKAFNQCGNSVYSNEILITSGPEFYQNLVVNPFAVPPEGYCPNTTLPKPSIPTSWYNTNGLTGVQAGWYWVTYDVSGNATYEPIQGNNISLANETRLVTCGLTSSCGTTPFDPPFELLVYEAPGIDGLDDLPGSLDTCCAGTALSSILPSLSPTGHYLQNGTGWEISTGQSSTGNYTTNLPTLLGVGDSGKWLRYRVKKDCSSHNDAVSPPIRFWVGDKPTLNVSQITLPTLCAGASVNSINVYVSDWNLFDDPEEAYGRWEVNLNGTWVEFSEFELGYNGKQVRYHAHNECGDTYLNAGAVSVTAGPEFNNPNEPPAIQPYYCLNDPFDYPNPPGYIDHGISTTTRWAYIDENGVVQPMPANVVLTAAWDSVFVCCQLVFNCSGSTEYVNSAFAQLLVFGPPSIIMPEDPPTEVGPVCAGPVDWDEWLPWGFEPEGHYESFEWKLATNPNGTYSSLPATLTYDGNDLWLKYYVYGCGNPVASDPIRVIVGDKPTLNTETVSQTGPVCAGRAPQDIFDVHVTTWNRMMEDTVQYWEVYYQNQWQILYQFATEHHGCPIRFVAHNRCGDHEPYPTLSSVQVTQGPEFAASFSYKSYLQPSYCVTPGQYLTMPSINPNDINANGLSDIEYFWEWSEDGLDYSPCTSIALTENNNGFLRCSLHSDYCGGDVHYLVPFPLVIVGQPVVAALVNETADSLCVGEPLSLDVVVDWHHGTQATSSSWQYTPVDQPNGYVDFVPEDGILETGEFFVNYHAVATQCGFDAYGVNPIRVTVTSAPAFVNATQPFVLDRFCENEVLTHPTTVAMTGRIENQGWLISVGQNPLGDYQELEFGYQLSLGDEGRWVRFFAEGCDGFIHHEEEIHVDGKPLEVYDVESRMCTGQKLSYVLHSSNSYPVTDREWRLNSPEGTPFDPNEYTFEQEGTYSIYYRVSNQCGDLGWQGPATVVVAEGPRFDNSTIPPGPLRVCTGSSLGDVLANLNPPQVLNPEAVNEDLGWYFRYVDGNGTIQYPVDQYTIIEESNHGYEICYGVKGDCSEVPVFSNGVGLHVFGTPEIVSLGTFDLQFCEGDPVSLMEPESIDYHHGEGYVVGYWQVRTAGGAWESLPLTWGNNHNSALIRYHVENTECTSLMANSESLIVHVSSAPVIHENNLPEESMSICSGGALGLSNPEVDLGDGVWQVSPNGVNEWSDQIGGVVFDPEHVDACFDGKWLRYYAQGECGEEATHAFVLHLMESADITISGQQNVAMMTSFWPGKYYYYPGTETTGLLWILEPDIWPYHVVQIDGKTCCEVIITCIGQATLKAVLGDGNCGADEMVINATFFDVEEQGQPRFEIYPNPAKHTVTVVAESMKQVNVFDMFGQLVRSYSCAEGDNLVFSVEDLAVALYIVEVQTDHGVIRKPLSVAR